MLSNFDKLKKIFQTFSERNITSWKSMFLMLKKSHMKKIDNKMSEQNDMILVMNFQVTIQVDFTQFNRVSILRPWIPIQIYLLERIKSNIPLHILITILFKHFTILLQQLNFPFFGHLKLKQWFIPLKKQSIKFSNSKPLISNLHIFNNLPYPLNIQPIKYLSLSMIYQRFVIIPQLRILSQ